MTDEVLEVVEVVEVEEEDVDDDDDDDINGRTDDTPMAGPVSAGERHSEKRGAYKTWLIWEPGLEFEW